MTEQQTPSAPAAAGQGGTSTSKTVAGPLTIRDLAVLGSVALIFIASVVPIIVTIAGSFNLWNVAGLFYLGVGVILPLAVGALFLVRRLSPGVNIRIGSLSIDQFASVVASFATFFFFTGTVTTFGVAYLLGLVGSVVLLTATVCAQWIPMLASDFAGRAEVPAHVAARNAVAPAKRPAAPKPVAATQNVAGAKASGKGAQQSQGGAAVPAAAAHTTQQAHAWNAPQAAAGHTAAGQIFTPAKETGAAGVAAAGAAAQTVADAAPAATAAAHAATGTAAGTAANGATAAGNTAFPAAQTVANPAARTTAQATTQAGAAAVPAAAGPAVDAGVQAGAAAGVANTGAGQSTDAPATTLNPQVAEPAAATAAPVKESIAATVNPKASAAPVVSDPFWFAVDRPQNVIDEKTRQFAFKLTPGSWILALEDRRSSFLVQDSHGKTGILLDLVGIERASDSQ
ncbi:MAG: hypothetical protein ABI563_13500 [Specibacter sp.]